MQALKDMKVENKQQDSFSKKDRWLRTIYFLVIKSNDPAGWTGVPMVLYSPKGDFNIDVHPAGWC